LPMQAALILFIGISAALVWRALREDAKALAGVGFLGAYAAPRLAMQGQGDLFLCLLYGLAVTLAALGVSLNRRWQEIGIHAHACAAGLAAIAYAGAHVPMPALQQQGLLVAYLFQFVGWVVLWPSRWKAEPPLEKIRSQEVPVLSG